VLNCPTWFDTAEKLLDYGYEYYFMEEFYEAGQVVHTALVAGGQSRAVDLVAASDLTFPLKTGESYEIGLQVPDSVSAPIKKGDVAGRAVAYIDGKEVASVDLVYAKDVPMNNLEAAIHRILDAWTLFV
jgi:D-alanyl-D-alanine carboxypeptidase (penicillin-binding protein 5/6)